MLRAPLPSEQDIVHRTIDTAASFLPAPTTALPTVAQRRVRRVMLVLHSHQSGGAERHLLELMLALSASGVDCIYAGPLDSWLGQQVAMHGLRRRHIGYKGFFDVISLMRLAWCVAQERPDIVHGHMTRGVFYGGLASRITGVPCIATAHSTNASKWFGLADRIIAVSDAVHAFLASAGHARKLRTVRHGIPDGAMMPHASRPTMRVHLQAGSGLVLTMAARFTPAKGQDLALRALALLPDRDWILVLAGALDNVYACAMRDLAIDLGISDRIRFVGHREDIANLYACTDILLAPSRREALSLTLLEAASFGIPVVATDVGGIAEAVEDGVTGLLSDTENVGQLSGNLCKMMDDAALRLRMGAAARHRYEAMFDVSRMARATLDVYEELIAERRA
jgi:glycosyltransferase involved in cell wall biosynthesis